MRARSTARRRSRRAVRREPRFAERFTAEHRETQSTARGSAWRPARVLGAWFGHLAHGTSRGEAKTSARRSSGNSALVVIGIDKDAEQIERAATNAKTHTLKRQVGDWDEAERDALEAIEHAQQHATA